jgi:LPXTG-site transpeptidase (sortase) family protein
LAEQIHNETLSPVPSSSSQNTLIIPTIALSQPLHEGTDTYKELVQGVWHWPYGSSPDKGSNTVLIGHRFTYTNPRGVFYSLDKVHTGDEIGVAWKNKMYLYRVAETKVVSPGDVAIEAPTQRPTLTLYTCTPLWWPTDRLVIIAYQEGT